MKMRIRRADPAGNITIFVMDQAERKDYAAISRQLLVREDLGPSLEVNTIFFRRSNYIKHLTNALKQGFFYFPKYLQNYFL